MQEENSIPVPEEPTFKLEEAEALVDSISYSADKVAMRELCFLLRGIAISGDFAAYLSRLTLKRAITYTPEFAEFFEKFMEEGQRDEPIN